MTGLHSPGCGATDRGHIGPNAAHRLWPHELEATPCLSPIATFKEGDRSLCRESSLGSWRPGIVALGRLHHVPASHRPAGTGGLQVRVRKGRDAPGKYHSAPILRHHCFYSIDGLAPDLMTGGSRWPVKANMVSSFVSEPQRKVRDSALPAPPSWTTSRTFTVRFSITNSRPYACSPVELTETRLRFFPANYRQPRPC